MLNKINLFFFLWFSDFDEERALSQVGQAEKRLIKAFQNDFLGLLQTFRWVIRSDCRLFCDPLLFYILNIYCSLVIIEKSIVTNRIQSRNKSFGRLSSHILESSSPMTSSISLSRTRRLTLRIAFSISSSWLVLIRIHPTACSILNR